VPGASLRNKPSAAPPDLLTAGRDQAVVSGTFKIDCEVIRTDYSPERLGPLGPSPLSHSNNFRDCLDPAELCKGRGFEVMGSGG